MRNKVISILICSVLAGISLLGLLLPDRWFSVREKRKLQQAPTPSAESLLDGSYKDKLEAYTLDQFPGRDSWITLKTVTDLSLGKRERNGVYFSKDGYLIDAFRNYDPEQLKANIAHLKTLSDQISGTFQIPVSVLLVPTAAEILEDKLPASAPHADESGILKQTASAGVNLIDPIPLLAAHRDEYLYYRTDHHSTSLGAWYCYCAWREYHRLPVQSPALWSQEALCDDFYGTTWARTGLPWTKPDTITAWYRHRNRHVVYNGMEEADSIYALDHLEKDPYAVFLNSNQALTVINGSGDSGKLLLIKDSFGNTFAQFPTEDYQQIHMIDPRFFHEDLKNYIRENGITDVLVYYGVRNFCEDTSLVHLN